MTRRVHYRRGKPPLHPKVPTELALLRSVYAGEKASNKQLPKWISYYGTDWTLHKAMEASFIIWVLEQCNWNRSQAADVLGISVRMVRYKIVEYVGRGLTTASELSPGECRGPMPPRFWYQVKQWMDFGESLKSKKGAERMDKNTAIILARLDAIESVLTMKKVEKAEGNVAIIYPEFVTTDELGKQFQEAMKRYFVMEDADDV